MIKSCTFAALTLMTMTSVGCGTIKEKTAPCRRPANLTSYTEDPREPCGTVRSVNDPVAAFKAIGALDQD